jgi:4-amino-4-deoxy-L-arabinose transferase-like glycosyltransferase
MQRRGDWVLPYFNGQPRLQKPPMSYWLAMSAHVASEGNSYAPVSEWEARLPSVFAAVALVALTMALALVVTDVRRTSLWAGALLASSWGFFDWSHSAQPEMLYAAFCALEVLGFAFARRAAQEQRSTLPGGVIAWSAFGAAVLTKGPLLPTFLLIGVVAGALYERRQLRPLAVLRPILGVVIALLIVAPWVVLVARRQPQAFEYWNAQMFDRTGGAAAAWWRPIELVYVRAAATLLAPWSLLVVAALVWPWKGRSQSARSSRWLWFVAIAPLVLLSFSAKAKTYYLLPAIAPLAVLAACAAGVALEIELPSARKWIARTLRAHTVFLVVASVGLVAYLFVRGPEVGGTTTRAAIGSTLAALALIVGVRAWNAAAASPELAAKRLLAAFGLVLIGGAWAVVDVGSKRFIDGTFAREIAAHDDPLRPMLVVDANPQLVCYYADRTVVELAPKDLAARVARDPNALVVSSDKASEEAHLGGTILAEQRHDGDVRILLDPSVFTRGSESTFEPAR